MPELTQLYHKQLDDSQLCPLCQASMYWIEGEVYYQPLNFHQCGHCQHCIFYGDKAPNCQCKRCLNKRKQSIQHSVATEKTAQRRYSKKNQDDVLLDDLTLVEKLFLLSLLDTLVDDHQAHDEFIDFKQYHPLQIAPSYALFKQLKQKFIQHGYLTSVNHELSEELYFTALRLHGYRDPSLLSLTHQLRQWFYQDFTQGIPYKDPEEVKSTLVQLLLHEVINFCQYRCQTWQVQFYANRHFENSCKLLLEQYSVTQLFYWVERALGYLHEQNLLHPENENFVNANLLRKTLNQYRINAQQKGWETPNLTKPTQLAQSQMNYIFIHKFLKMDSKILVQPIWKCWQEILPRLRFFSTRHCIHCGGSDLEVEYSTDQAVSFRCLSCKQQDHYFVE